MEKYKCLIPDKNRDVDIIWLQAISDCVGTGTNPMYVFRKGDVTWTASGYTSSHWFPERNRHAGNYDKRCFMEIPYLIATGLAPHICGSEEKPKYRFKTEQEFKAEDKWSHAGVCPDGWVSEMNYLLGIPLSELFNHRCDGKNFLSIPDGEGSNWYIDPKNYKLIEEPVIVDKSLYRFKTESEFKVEMLWNYASQCPIGWVTQMKVLLGRQINREFNEKCRNGLPLETGRNSQGRSYIIDPNSYKPIEPITYSMVDIYGTPEDPILRRTVPKASKTLIKLSDMPVGVNKFTAVLDYIESF